MSEPVINPDKDKPGPVVVDGVLQYTSVSAMATYETCPAKWWYRYVARLPGDTSPSLTFGTQAHERLERYLKGLPVELQATEKAVLPYLPPQRDGLLVEQKFQEGRPLMLGAIPIMGKADCIEIIAGKAVVTDWKFKADADKWAAKPYALANPRDTDGRQLIAAAQWAFQNRPDLDSLTLRHVTSQTGGIDPDGQPKGPFLARESCSIPLKRNAVELRWRNIVDDFEAPLLRAAGIRAVDDMSANPKNCFEYGRLCTYAGQCPHTKRKKVNTVNLGSMINNEIVTSPTTQPPAQARLVEFVGASAAIASGVVLYFGGSYPLRHKSDTLHAFMQLAEHELLTSLLGTKYNPDNHFDVRAINHDALGFGRWKAALGLAARQMLPRLAGGHYLVSNEERIQVVANAILPMVHAVGGPGL